MQQIVLGFFQLKLQKDQIETGDFKSALASVRVVHQMVSEQAVGGPWFCHLRQSV